MAKRQPPISDIQPDLFAASFADIPVRDQRDTMERPFFSLAKRPRLTPIEYQVGNVWVEVSANPKFGMATIWDADVLIWASTQITEALDRHLKPSRTIQFHPYNLLRSIRRTTGGADYTRLRGPGTADAYGRADQYPRRRTEEIRIVPLDRELDRDDGRGNRRADRHDDHAAGLAV